MGKEDATHRKMKENFGKQVNANIVRDKDGKALTESRDKVRRWEEYKESLYKGDADDLVENESEV